GLRHREPAAGSGSGHQPRVRIGGLNDMAEIPYIAAIEMAIHGEMERDESVLYFGQNIATSENDKFLQAFGPKRVRVTPISDTAADAKGLMATAIRDDNPVAYFHHYLLTLEPGEVPDGEHLVPFGQAAVRREGGDVTIVALGYMVGKALAAAERLAGEGVQAEVIDPRTLNPLDLKTILESVDKTGHLVLVDQATRHGSAS